MRDLSSVNPQDRRLRKGQRWPAAIAASFLLCAGCGANTTSSGMQGPANVGGALPLSVPVASATPDPAFPRLSGTLSMTSSAVSETGTVYKVNVYGASNPLVLLHPGSPYDSIDAYMTGADKFAVGQKVTVTGAYVSSAGHQWINATAISLTGASPGPVVSPTGAPAIMPDIATKHVLTADYDVSSLSPAARAPYVNWVSTSFQNNPGVRAAGIKAMYYTDPNRALPGQNFWSYISGNEDNFAHDCSGNRIRSLSYGGEYLMDPGVNARSTVKQAWLAFIQSRTDASHQWDAIFEDGTNNATQNVTALPCGYNATAWTNASIDEATYQSPNKVIVNGLSLGTAMDASSGVIGGMRESSYGGANVPELYAPFWTDNENNQLTQARVGKLFVSLSTNNTAASSSSVARIYLYASFLMTYDVATSVYWTDMTTPSGFHVLPETKIVPQDPLTPTPSDISGLQIAGVYGREYAHCYSAGVYVGPCATVVNPDRYNAHPYPYGSKYAHTLTVSGSGVLDGGSVSTLGGAPPISLAHQTAVIVFQ